MHVKLILCILKIFLHLPQKRKKKTITHNLPTKQDIIARYKKYKGNGT